MGGGISMERGFHIFSSIKKKLNTCSFTETEVMVVGDCMSSMLWTRYWLDAQVYYVFGGVVFQDNKSAIILENNRNALISKNMKHINIRYYLVKNIIRKYELSVEWCSTGYTIGYFTTKPTQSSKFEIFRGQLIGVNEAQDLGPGNPKNIMKIQEVSISEVL